MRGYLLGIGLGIALLWTVAAPIGRYAVGAVSFRVAYLVEVQSIRHRGDWDARAWFWVEDTVVAVNNWINGP